MHRFTRILSPNRLRSLVARLALGLVIPTAACRPDASVSETQSLDNFAAGRVTHLNECHAPDAVAADGKPNAALLAAQPLKDAIVLETKLDGAARTQLAAVASVTLTAVQPAIQQALAGRTRIVLTDDVATSCAGRALSANLELDGCYKIVAAGKGDNASTLGQISLYLKASGTAVEHGLLQGLARVFVELRSAGLPRDVVGLSYVYDRAAAGVTTDVQLTRYFGTKDGDALLARAKAGKLSGVPTLLAWSAFANRVLAETADSWFCDATRTRPALLRDFPLTAQAFAPLATLWAEYGQRLAASGARSGLALQGEGEESYPEEAQVATADESYDEASYTGEAQDWTDDAASYDESGYYDDGDGQFAAAEGAGAEAAAEGDASVYDSALEFHAAETDGPMAGWTSEAAAAEDGCEGYGLQGAVERCRSDRVSTGLLGGQDISMGGPRRQPPPAEFVDIPQLMAPPTPTTIPASALPTESSVTNRDYNSVVESYRRALSARDTAVGDAMQTAVQGMMSSAAGLNRTGAQGFPDGTLRNVGTPSYTSGSGSYFRQDALYRNYDRANEAVQFYQSELDRYWPRFPPAATANGN